MRSLRVAAVAVAFLLCSSAVYATSADMSVVSTGVSPGAITLGTGNVTYSVNLYNYGPNPGTSAVFTANLPAGSTFVSATATSTTCGQAAGVVTCSWASYPASTSYNATIVVTPGTAGANTLTSNISASDPDPDATNNNGSGTATVNSQIDLAITNISDSPNDITLGTGNVQYFINLYNYSTSKATNAQLTITLPASSTFVSATPTGAGGTCGSPTGGVLTCSWADYPSGSSYSVTVTVTPGVAGTNTLSASIAADQPDPDNVTAGHLNSDSEQTTVNDQIDLAVTNISDSPTDITLGTGNVQYFINLYNYSTSKATNAQLTITLPASSTFVSATPTGAGGTCGSPSGGVLTCSWADYPSGSSYSVTVTVTPGVAGTNTLSASIAADQPDPDNVTAGHLNSDSEQTTVNNQIDLAVTNINDSPNDITLGTGNVQYFINLYNYSTSKATNAQLTITLPASSTFVSATPTGAGGTCGSPTGGVLTCSWADYPSGSSYSVTVTVTPGVAGTNTLSASIAADQPDPDNITAGHLNSDSEQTTVNDQIDLAVFNISDSPNDITLGTGDVQYFINMYNYSSSKATNAQLTVTIPASSTFVSATPTGTGGTCGAPTGGVFTCSWADYPSGASYSVTVTVTPGVAGTNTLSASIAATQPDPDNVTAGHLNSDSEQTTVNSQIDLAVTNISDSPNDITLGTGDVQYFINLYNYSTSKATNAQLTITLPASSTFVSATPTGTGGTCGSPSGGVLTCSWADYPSGSSYSVTVTVTPGVAGTNTLSASIAATQPDPDNVTAGHLNSDSEQTTVNSQIDLAVTGISDSPDPRTLGAGNVQYFINLYNYTSSKATNAQLTITLPASSGFVSATPTGTGGTCGSPSGGVLTCSWADYPSGSSYSVTVTVTPGVAGTNTLTASISATQPDPDNVTAGHLNSDTENTTINPSSAPTITGFTPSSGPVGTVVTISGANFTGTTQVKFNGIVASFSTPNDSTVNATVPSGASSGVISVTNGIGTTNSSGSFTVLPGIVVTNTNDSGTGSLRDAIAQANSGACVSPCTIKFQIGSGLQTITPSSPFANITAANVTIDGTTQPGYSGTPLIEISGVSAGASSRGLVLAGGGATVKGLVIRNFTAAYPYGYGIYITSANNSVKSNYIGTNAAGSAASANRAGIVLDTAAATNNTIGGLTATDRNLISGNTTSGISIEGSASSNSVIGNYIGTDVTGAADLGNGFNGINIEGANNNIIGGTSASARNIISGNDSPNINLWFSASGNSIQGNYIGTDVTGALAVGNGSSGVNIEGSATGNFVGGTSAGAGNLISGNAADGVRIDGSGTNGNFVQGNVIGLNAAGSAALANAFIGVSIGDGAQSNTVGGTTANARNVISGNGRQGLALFNTNTNSNTVQGNYIGTNPSGNSAIGNTWAGIGIWGGAQSNTVGGTAANARNLISGNLQDGVAIRDANTSSNAISGNYIGTDVSGSFAVANGWYGVDVFSSATNNTIGGSVAGAMNLLSGNSLGGVLFSDAGTSGNFIGSNFIGLNAAASGAISNSGPGVSIVNSATNNIVGSSSSPNKIAFNNKGVVITGTSSTGNRISSNAMAQNTSIGIDLANNGITANDATDSDTGPNNLQNFPVINSATISGGTSLDFKLTIDSSGSSPSLGLKFELFKADTSSPEQGLTFLGTTACLGPTFSNTAFNMTVAGVSAGNKIVATATSFTDNTCTTVKDGTSEFSAATTVTQGQAALSITKSAPASVSAGQTFNYTLQVKNVGPYPAENVSVSDTLPAGLTWNSTTAPGFSCSAPPNIVCTASSFAVTTSNITFNVTAPASPATINNSVTITATNDSTPGDNSDSAVTSVTAASADLALTKSPNVGTIAVNGSVTYTITVTNNGPSPASGVVVSDPLPPGQTATSAVSTQGSCTTGTNVSCSIGAMPNGATVTITIVATATQGGTWTNIVTKSASEGDPNSANDTAAGTVTVTGSNTLTVITSADSGNGSLRQAILDANSGVCSAICTINFNVSPLQQIALTSALPAITATVTIDGTTQPGYTTTPLIHLDGTSCGACNGLTFSAGQSMLKALEISDFFGNGIVVTATATGVRLIENSTHDNSGLGIDLGNDGPTPNDAGDSDTGANNFQNKPVINSAILGGGTLFLDFSVDSANVLATNSLKVEFYKAESSGEGLQFLGYGCYFNTRSLVNQTLTFGQGSITNGTPIVATATSFAGTNCTSPSDGTSEFSASVIAANCTPPPATITAPSGVCPFSTGHGASVPATAGASYSWSIANGTITGGLGTNAITFDAGSSGAVTLNVTVALNGCSANGSQNVTIRPTPTATSSGTATICAGGSTSISAALTGTAPFNLTWSDGFTQVVSSGTTATRTVSPASGTNYNVTTITDAFCSGTGSGVTFVSVNPAPTASVSGSTAICAGNSASIGASLTGTAPWNITWSDGFTQVVSSGTTASRSVTPSSTITYTITSLSDASCSGTSSGSATITVNPAPTPTITGPTATCASSPVTLDAGVFASYLWNTGATTQTITVTPSSTTTYSVTVTNGAGCTGSDTHTVTVSGAPAATITAPAAVCASSTGNSASVPPGATSYVWTISGGTITAGQNTRAITFSANTSGSVVLGVTVTTGSCTANGSQTIPITAPPAAAITGPTTVCANSTFTLDAGSHATYQWNTGATTRFLTMTQVSASATYSVIVTDGGCSATATHTVTTTPSPDATITAPSQVDPSSSNNAASVPNAGAGATYSWSITNGTITSGSGTSNILFSAGANGTVDLDVTVTFNGCSSNGNTQVSIGTPQSQQADLAVTKSAPASVSAGASLVYTIVVTNNGPLAATGQLVDGLPNGIAVNSIDAGSWSCTNANGQINCGGSLASGASNTITLNATAPQQAGTITNNVVVTGPLFDPNPSNNSAFVTTNVVANVSCPTTPPSLLAPADNATVTSPVAFSWSAVSGATSYELWITNAGTTTLAASTNATSITSAVPSGASSWFVIARLGGNCDALTSATRTFTVQDSGNCATHIAPLVTAPSDGSTISAQTTISWMPAPQAIGYRVWIEVNGSAPQDIGTTNGAITLNASLPPGNIALYVDALFGGCPPVRSNTIHFTVAAPDPCAQRASATPASPANNANVSSSAVTLQWLAAANATEYRVWASVNGAAPALLGTTTSTSFDALFANGTVIWWIEVPYPGCASTESQHFRFTIPPAGDCGTAVPTLISPANGASLTNGNVTFQWTGVPNAIGYDVYLAAANGTPVLIGSTNATSFTDSVPPGALTWSVVANVDRCPPRSSQTATFSYTPPAACAGNQRPIAIAPLDGSAATAPVSFDWTAPAGATRYELYVIRGNGAPTLAGSTTNSALANVSLAPGSVRWFVRAFFAQNCSPLDSDEQRLEIVTPPPACSTLAPPVISAPGEISSGVAFLLQWGEIAGATGYQLQIASAPDFNNAELITTGATSHSITRTNNGTAPLGVYARVRALDARCTPAPTVSPYGPTAAIFVLPPQQTIGSVPLSDPASVHYTIALGSEFAGQTFTATPSEPWLSVAPSSGVVGAFGTTLNVTANPTILGVGTHSGAIRIILNSASSRIASNATTSVNPSISINLVTPVASTPANTPSPDTMIIPAVANADGINAHFQSDVRVANTSAQLIKYQLTFIPSGDSGITKGAQTTFSIEPGRTIALDDILRSFFGTGTSNAVGVLQIKPLTPTSSSTSSAAFGPLANLVSFASSRTFNVTPNGTFGQYVPAVPYANFADKSTVLSLQQIAQNSKTRSNLGLVEGSGNPADLLIRVFGGNGQQITSFTQHLNGGQHTQLNSFLFERGITLEDGRIEVQVTSSSGKVTAYASVLDNETSDAVLVTPVALGSAGNTKWVIPGVADIRSGFADWQSDVRVFNAGTEPVDVTASFYSQSGGEPKVQPLTLAAGEVKQLDKILPNFFGVTNDGGALHLATAKASRIVATARTYNQTSKGTFGQFVNGVTPSEAVAVGTRPLQLLQVEESPRMRSNVGFAEVTGKPVKLEVTVTPPDAKFAAVIEVDLAANEFRQLGSLLAGLGLGDTYNARVSVRAISGEGRATAYASVIDLQTNDPTFVEAQ